MNTKKKTIKSILCCTTAGAALAMSGYAVLNLNNPKYEAFAVNANSIPVSISNSNFDKDKKTSYPYNPSSYTAYNQGKKVESSSNKDANITAGVINLSNEKYETKFSLAKRTSLDDYVLMIDSSKEEDGKTILHDANYGFQTSSTYKMEQNSKYMFTVDVFTTTDANIASLYLFDNNGNVFSSIKNINSYNTWTPYTFFVSTNSISAVEVKLGMYLEGAGTVLFDNLSAYKLSNNEYEFSKDTAVDGKFVEIDKVDNIVETYKINNNGQFENTNDDSIYSGLTNTLYDFDKRSNLTTVNDSDGTNSKALLIENLDKTYTQYETKDNLLTFEQNTIYKVSINVKTKGIDGTANLQLVRTDIDENDDDYSTDHNKTIKITTNSVSNEKSVTNDYKTYSFLINSHSSKSVSYKLVFGLGLDKDTASLGKMYISQIEVSKVDYNTYSSASTGSGTEKIDFVKAYKDSKIQLDNGDFNAFKIADYNSPMPATPISWDVTTGKNTQKYGVVNTSTASFEKLKELNLSNLANPYPSEKNQNVLMMYNETADSLSYTSTAKSLTAKSYHKFEINVQTQNAPLTVSLVTKKGDSEVVLSSKTVDTNASWQNVTMYLHTGYQDMSVSLKLTLNSTSYGYAYIDNARFDYILTAAQLEEEFKSAESSEFTSVSDLTNLFDNGSVDNFSSSTMFASEKVSGVQSGIITLNSNHLDEVIYDTNNIETFNSVAGDKVIGIRSTVDTFYTIKSNVGFKMTTGSDKYYKISVSVYTQNIASNDSSIDANTLGASIKLSDFDETFTNIQSNDEWTTYTFYIQPSSDTTAYLELSLGSNDYKTKGDVFFGNIEFYDNITSEEYNAVKATENVVVLKDLSTSSEDEEESTEEETKSKKGLGSAWIYLIPSLLTAAAIIIAVVGFVLRKLKFRKPKKKTKTTYDRNKTVSIQYYTRKATTLREEKIRELTADLDKINAERKKFEDDYKHELTKLREMKIKRANPQEIAKLEKELKKNQKLSASLGVTANKISNDLEYTKTDAYLNALVRKLSREASQKPEQEDENK